MLVLCWARVGLRLLLSVLCWAHVRCKVDAMLNLRWAYIASVWSNVRLCWAAAHHAQPADRKRAGVLPNDQGKWLIRKHLPDTWWPAVPDRIPKKTFHQALRRIHLRSWYLSDAEKCKLVIYPVEKKQGNKVLGNKASFTTWQAKWYHKEVPPTEVSPIYPFQPAIQTGPRPWKFLPQTPKNNWRPICPPAAMNADMEEASSNVSLWKDKPTICDFVCFPCHVYNVFRGYLTWFACICMQYTLEIS